MRAKRKKSTTLTPEQPVLVAPDGRVELEPFLHRVIKSVGDLGFDQVLPEFVEEAKFYGKSPELSAIFSGKLLPLYGSNSADGLVLSPTHMFSILRRFLDNVKHRTDPYVAKWFYLAPLQRPTARKPEIAHELGIFVLGDDSPLAHARLLHTIQELLTSLSISDFVIEIGSLGCKSCYKDYQDVLADHLGSIRYSLCGNCKQALPQNPFAVWNCANATCRERGLAAPQIVDFLDDACKADLTTVLESIDELGIPYLLNPTLSPPLAHGRVVFRMSVPGAGGAGQILGHGGGFGKWTVPLGAPEEMPAVGCLMEFEKLVDLIPRDGKFVPEQGEVFMIALGDQAARRAMAIENELRQIGIKVMENMLGEGGIKSQLKKATDYRCGVALIIGQKEALDETVILRDTNGGMQEVFRMDRIADEVRKRVGR